MSSHNKIVLSGDPKGHFVEGILNTGQTPKPGQVVQIVSTALVGGKFTWTVYDRAADGNRPAGPLIVLTENWKLGKTPTDAYVAGEIAQGYIPVAGDELQVLLQNQAGTADSFAIGALLIVDDGTGKSIATAGSPESEPFMIAETVAALTADALAHVIYTGY